MRLYHLKQWTVLEISHHASDFLKGLSTNTLEAPFSAFVNIHGRIISVFAQQRINDDIILIAVPKVVLEALMTHLSRYALISATKLSPLSKQVYVDIDSGAWIFEDRLIDPDISEEDFTEWRLKNNVPLQGIDFQADEFILNVDSGQFVSFTKGCFLGQEPVAKVHNRSKPSKKLIVGGQDSVGRLSEVTSAFKDTATGMLRGFVFVKNN